MRCVLCKTFIFHVAVKKSTKLEIFKLLPYHVVSIAIDVLNTTSRRFSSDIISKIFFLSRLGLVDTHNMGGVSEQGGCNPDEGFSRCTTIKKKFHFRLKKGLNRLSTIVCGSKYSKLI